MNVKLNTITFDFSRCFIKVHTQIFILGRRESHGNIISSLTSKSSLAKKLTPENAVEIRS